MRTITFETTGRLGNQLFTFASAQGFAVRTGRRFLMPDDTGLHDVFKNLPPPATVAAAAPRQQHIVHEAKYKVHGYSKACEDEVLRDTHPAVKLLGYFQTPKYFPRGFTLQFKDEIEKMVDDATEDLNLSRCVAIHVRRGDYVGSASHPVQTLDYYRTALRLFPGATPVVVSDDPKWCRLHFKRAKVIDTGSAASDLCLLTKCGCGVIMSNSSFSWWGAWLTPGRKIVAPRKWFGPQLEHLELSEHLPEEWIVL